MPSRDPINWMWAEALQLLNQAERMQRQFFHLDYPRGARVAWQPPVDVFEDERELVILVALPGVPADRIEVTSEPGALVVRAESPLPFSASRRAVRQLEIPYGYFERRIALPEGRLEAGTREVTDGCLILRLRKTG